MTDTIFIDPTNRPPYPPEEPAESDPDYIKHVHCDGARFHVLSWSGRLNSKGRFFAEEHCSEPRCIKNKPMGDKDE
jgi:hypothetical protein